MRSAYKILGLAIDASDAEVRSVYRRLARRAHPDRAGDSAEAHERFLEIRAAYQILIDPSARAAHDRDPNGTFESELFAERRLAQLARRRRRLRRLYE